MSVLGFLLEEGVPVGLLVADGVDALVEKGSCEVDGLAVCGDKEGEIEARDVGEDGVESVG